MVVESHSASARPENQLGKRAVLDAGMLVWKKCLPHYLR